MTSLRLRKPSSYTSTSPSIELPTYPGTSTKATSCDLDFYGSVDRDEDCSSNPEPIYTSKALADSPDFRGLLVTNDSWLNLSLTPLSETSSPLFYVTNTTFSFTRPSLVLTSVSKNGPVLGVLKILWSRSNPFALSSSINVPPSTNWESLERTSNWTHSTYEFPWEGMTYVWERTKCRWLGDQPDLELREKGKGVGGKVLAVYRGEWDWKGRRRGVFYLRHRGNSSEGEEVWGSWEQVVILTGCGIIEAARRRARARRNRGGGGP